MTPDDLNALLNHQPLWQTLDVRSLMLNHMKHLDDTLVERWLMEALPNLDPADVKGFLYMQRP
jgi:hypothetical protein